MRSRLILLAPLALAVPAAAQATVYLTTEGPADYRIYVRSKTFSQKEAAALIVGARGDRRHLQAASL